MYLCTMYVLKILPLNKVCIYVYTLCQQNGRLREHMCPHDAYSRGSEWFCSLLGVDIKLCQNVTWKKILFLLYKIINTVSHNFSET